jgi:hypothetical protein
MAKATKSPKGPGQGQPPAPGQGKATRPTTPAPAAKTGQPPKPPAKETVIEHGVIRRYEHGQLVSTTPATATPPAKAKTTKATATPPTVQLGELDGEGLYEFTPQGSAPNAPVRVLHWRGYTLLSEDTRTAAFAAKLQRDVLASGKYVLIDGVQYVLQDEAP